MWPYPYAFILFGFRKKEINAKKLLKHENEMNEIALKNFLSLFVFQKSAACPYPYSCNKKWIFSFTVVFGDTYKAIIFFRRFMNADPVDKMRAEKREKD